MCDKVHVKEHEAIADPLARDILGHMRACEGWSSLEDFYCWSKTLLVQFLEHFRLTNHHWFMSNGRWMGYVKVQNTHASTHPPARTNTHTHTPQNNVYSIITKIYQIDIIFGLKPTIDRCLLILQIENDITFINK